MEKVDSSGGPDACWPWIASANRGYGQFGLGGAAGAPVRATHVAFALAYGHVPDGDECVLHSCDNPPCCNPAHLFLGTRTDNAADRDGKGRGTRPPLVRGERSHLAKLSEDDVRAIRAARAGGETATSIAARYGVRQSNVSAICLRQTWKHVA